MAEKEGFEPSIPVWGIHDFQSCALGQLRDFSIPFLSSSVATDWLIILHGSLFVNRYFKFFQKYFSTGKNGAPTPLDPATTARSPSTVLRTASVDRGIFPRPKKVSTGHFLTFAALRPAFQIRPHQQKINPIRMDGVYFLAEKEGFEPSIPFWGIHDFQSCALGQLRDFSKWRRSIDLLIIHQHSRFVNTFFQKFQIIFSGYNRTGNRTNGRRFRR